jgi:hypothetical protein
VLAAENLLLRKQLAFYQERRTRPRRLTDAARFSLALWSRLFDWKDALVIVKPETLIRWRFEVPLNPVHADRERVNQVEALGMRGQYRRENTSASHVVARRTTAHPFLSILSIKRGNWFYWADRAETADRAESKESPVFMRI